VSAVRKAESHADGRPAPGQARVERILDRLAYERVGEVLRFEELVVDRIDVHFAGIHRAKMPGGKSGHRGDLGQYIART